MGASRQERSGGQEVLINHHHSKRLSPESSAISQRSQPLQAAPIATVATFNPRVIPEDLMMTFRTIMIHVYSKCPQSGF